MNSLLVEFQKEVLFKRMFYIPLIILSIMAYGFSLFNRTIGWDDLLRDHYFGNGNISLSGRWGQVVWIKLFGYEDFDPFIDRFTALLLLIATSVLFCLLLFSIKKLRSVFPYTISACAFITYPLINELWEYCGVNYFMAGGLALSTLAIYMLRNNNHSKKWSLLAGLLLILPISSYESSIFYYLSLVFGVIFLENLYRDKYREVKQFLNDILYYLIPIALALVIRMAISFGIRFLYGLEGVSGGATDINWFSDTPQLVLMKIAGGFFLKYVLASLVYYPIAIFLISLIAFLFFIFFRSYKDKKYSLFVYGILFVASLFALAILQGNTLTYRAAQTITLFIAVVAFLLGELSSQIKNNKVKIFSYLILSGVCWHQAAFMNKILGLNNLRSENEAYIVRSIGERIIRDYDKKPVVFISPYSAGPWIKDRINIGNNSWNEQLYNHIIKKVVPESFNKYMSEKYIETNVDCATEQYAQLQLIFNYYGYDIDVVGPEERPYTPSYMNRDLRLLKEAMSVAEDRKMRPYEIFDNGDYLIVTMSNQRNFFKYNE